MNISIFQQKQKTIKKSEEEIKNLNIFNKKEKHVKIL